jgi:hypothetical protein
MCYQQEGDAQVVISDVLLVTRHDQHEKLLHHRPQCPCAGAAGVSSKCIKSGLPGDDLAASNMKLALQVWQYLVLDMRWRWRGLCS